MDAVSGSLFCQFFLALVRVLSRAWDESLPGRFCRAVAGVWSRWWSGSALVRFFFRRGGVLPRAWSRSFCCRALSFLVNLPVALLHWVYLKLKPWFEGSVLCPFIFGLGEQVPIAMGWLMLLFMNIDYARWSNGYSFLGFVLLLLLFLDGGMRRRSLRLDLASVGLYPVVFFIAVFLSWPLSLYPELSARYIFYYITCALCLALTVSAVETPAQLERLAVFGCLGLAGAALAGIAQRFQGVAVIRAYVDMTLNPDMPGRVYSYYSNPNAFAEMLVMVIPVAVGLLFGAKKKSSRWIGFLSAALGIVALIMTYCRASWVGSTSSRVPLMQAGLRIIKANPVLGAGLGGDAVRQASNDIHAYTASYARFTHSHSLYLQLWLEHGLLGFAAFVAGGWHMMKQGANAVLRETAPRSTRMIVLGALSAVAGSLVSGLADYIFNYPRVMLIYWFTASLLLAGVKLARRGERAPR